MTSMQNIQPNTYQRNSKGNIEIGGMELSQLIKDYGSPLYVLCEETLRQNARDYENAFKEHYPDHLVVYASKALNTRAICKIMDQEKLGLDVVSGGELFTALSVDFPAEKIIFHGNNKSKEELEYAIDNEVTIIVDNFHEIGLIQEILEHRKKYEEPVDKIKMILRVTPGIECHTHEYIKTGMIDSKFGFNLGELDQAVEKLVKLKKQNSCIKILGLHAHIGSQIFETEPQCDAAQVLLEKYAEIKEKYSLEFSVLNVGGGLGIRYTKNDDPPTVREQVQLVADRVREECARLGLKQPKLMMEPGRSIAGPAGVTVYQVGNIKSIKDPKTGDLIRKYVAVDGGMSDNSRPIMYQAKYYAEKDGEANGKEEKVTIAGKYCESGDILIKDIVLPELNAKDRIVVFATGAYNYSMASNYNRAVKPAMVLVNQGSAEIIVERESFEDLIAKDRLPDNLGKELISSS